MINLQTLHPGDIIETWCSGPAHPPQVTPHLVGAWPPLKCQVCYQDERKEQDNEQGYLD